MNKVCYLELFGEHLDDCCQSMFQQDSALAHTSKLVKNLLGWVGINYIKDWPRNQPHHNTTENIYSLMKRHLRDIPTVPKLKEHLHDLWGNLEPNLLQHLAGQVV